MTGHWIFYARGTTSLANSPMFFFRKWLSPRDLDGVTVILFGDRKWDWLLHIDVRDLRPDSIDPDSHSRHCELHPRCACISLRIFVCIVVCCTVHRPVSQRIFSISGG